MTESAFHHRWWNYSLKKCKGGVKALSTPQNIWQTFPPGGSGPYSTTPWTSTWSYTFLSREDSFQHRRFRPLTSQIMVKQTSYSLCHAALTPSLAVSLSQEAPIPGGCCSPPHALPELLHLRLPRAGQVALGNSSFPLPHRKNSWDKRLRGSLLCSTWPYLLFQTCHPIVTLNFRKTN